MILIQYISKTAPHFFNYAKLYIVSNTKLENAIRLYRMHGFVDSTEARHTSYARGDITLEMQMQLQ